MTCKNCFHYNACNKFAINLGLPTTDEVGTNKYCGCYKSAADVVEIGTIKKWLYETAINNVGCVLDGDFSTACEEIISRLDGLRAFAQEKMKGE